MNLDFPGAWAIARLVRGEPVNQETLTALSEPWSHITTALLRRNGTGAAEIFDYELAQLAPDVARQIRAAVLGADALSPQPPRASVLLLPEIPELPKSAHLSDSMERAASSVGGWLTAYTNYGNHVSPRTPGLFHESAGLWIGGLGIARRLRLPLAHGDVFPNLYVLWIALTTLYAKSTALNIILRLLSLFDHLLLSNEFSPEALLTELAGKEPTTLADDSEGTRETWLKGRNFAAQRGIVLDEASSLFAGMRRDYLAGVAEMLLRLYDQPSDYRRHTRGGGFVTVRAASMSFIGATTPARLTSADTASAWRDGLFARFALLTPDSQPVWCESKPRIDIPSSLTETISKLATELLPQPTWPNPPAARDVVITSEAFKASQAYSKALEFDILTSDFPPDQRLFGNYGRLSTNAFKIALILAALDWASGEMSEPQINLGHWARAQMIVEKWRASAHRLLGDLSHHHPNIEIEEKIIRYLEKAGTDGLTVRDLYRALHEDPDIVEGCVFRLEQNDILQRFTPPGAKASRCRLVSHTQVAQ